MCGTTTVLVMFTVVLLGVMLAPVSALRCYSCASTLDSGCNDPFKNSSSVGSCNSGTHCFKTKTESSGSTVVVRSCGTTAGVTNRCESDTVSGIKQAACVCNTDFCNTAHQLSMSVIMVMVLLFACLIGQFSNQ